MEEIEGGDLKICDTRAKTIGGPVEHSVVCFVSKQKVLFKLSPLCHRPLSIGIGETC